MVAFAAIAEAAIADFPRTEGVEIFLPAGAFSFAAPANDVVAGSLIDIAVSDFDLTGEAFAPTGGTLIDIAFRQLALTKHDHAAAAGASVIIDGRHAVRIGSGIAEGAITEIGPIAVHTHPTHMRIFAVAPEPAAGAAVQLGVSGLDIDAGSMEAIARLRRIKKLAIAS